MYIVWMTRLTSSSDTLLLDAGLATPLTPISSNCHSRQSVTTSPTSMFRHAYVEDVAEAFIRALANPVAFHKASNLAGEEFLSLDDYVRAIADTLGRNVHMVRVPLDWLRRQPGPSGYQAPFVGERFVQDIARMKHVCARVPGSSLSALRRSSAGDRSRARVDEGNASDSLGTVSWFWHTFQVTEVSCGRLARH